VNVVFKPLLIIAACLSLSCCQQVDPDSGGGEDVIAAADLRIDTGRLIEPVEITLLDEVFGGGLYQPQSMSTSASGLICVADMGNHRVLAFNEDLDVVAEIGREGSGPGEFSQVSSCAITEDDHILALDVGRLSQFEVSGQLVATFRLDLVSIWATVIANGTVLTVSSDFRTLTLQSPISQTSRTIDLPTPPVPCGDDDRRRGSFSSQIMSGASPNGRHAVLARFSACSEEGNATHSLVARVDLETGSSQMYPLAVYDDFREWKPLAFNAKGVATRMMLHRPTTDGTRNYFLHAYTRRVGGFHLTPLDVWEVGRTEPVRLYVALGEDRVERTRLTMMASTLSGDLLIIDDYNETLLRLDAADLSAALRTY